jgi:hypothetical protein
MMIIFRPHVALEVHDRWNMQSKFLDSSLNTSSSTDQKPHNIYYEAHVPYHELKRTYTTLTWLRILYVPQEVE